jgi:alpha-beta hydrolase superfamily lysophospholipase
MGGSRKKQKQSVIKVHKVSYILVMSVLLIAGALITFFLIEKWHTDRKESAYQDSIQRFYDPPSPLPSTSPGHVIRSEKMNVTVPHGGAAYRILYVSQAPSGKPAVSSGMVIVPSGEVPAGGRKVVAWAHGTLGFGDACTPSRSMKNAVRDMQDWLDAAMQRGYVVAATDYVGIGTPGDQYYLIGKSEANDVLNSVRAARNMPEANASNEFIPWGHSQGGHAALFAALEAPAYAPELKVMGVAAAAPAAELGPLFSLQYNKTVAWAIGPDAAVSWPKVYPNLDLETVLTRKATRDYERLAFGCIEQQAVGLTIRALLKDQFFASDPLQQPAWQHAVSVETPKVADITVPIYVAQGLEDIVVLPATTALLAQNACTAGRTLEMNWMGGMNHQLAAVTAGPSAIAWMQDRFAAAPAPSSCSQPLPVEPASV